MFLESTKQLLLNIQAGALRLAYQERARLAKPPWPSPLPATLKQAFTLILTARRHKPDWATPALNRHFLNTDLPALGISVDPQLMHRYWRRLAHLQGQLFNASTLAGSLGISASSSTRYLDHLCDTLMVRRLEPHFVNLIKRLVKSPKVSVRDSGLLHSLLSIH